MIGSISELVAISSPKLIKFGIQFRDFPRLEDKLRSGGDRFFSQIPTFMNRHSTELTTSVYDSDFELVFYNRSSRFFIAHGTDTFGESAISGTIKFDNEHPKPAEVRFVKVYNPSTEHVYYDGIIQAREDKISTYGTYGYQRSGGERKGIWKMNFL